MNEEREDPASRLRAVAGRLVDRLPLHWAARLIPARSPLARWPARAMGAAEVDALGRTLIVAPHPDDETFGCGGLLALLARRGRAPRVVFVSDGAASHPHIAAERLVALRKEEARSALAALGLPDGAATHLDLPDGGLPFAGETDFAEAVAAFGACLRAGGTDTIVLPWRRDSSRDHRATFGIVLAARARNAPRARVLEYPVWAWLNDEDLPSAREAAEGLAAWRLDISAVRTAKRRAIACYRSQTGGLEAQGDWRLPRHFLASFARDSELFFEAPDPPISTAGDAAAAQPPA